jgi:hypothetical protein
MQFISSGDHLLCPQTITNRHEAKNAKDLKEIFVAALRSLPLGGVFSEQKFVFFRC